MYTSCQNKNICRLTLVNFITEDRMLRNTYLYENRIFTKWKPSIICGGKEKALRAKMKRDGVN